MSFWECRRRAACEHVRLLLRRKISELNGLLQTNATSFPRTVNEIVVGFELFKMLYSAFYLADKKMEREKSRSSTGWLKRLFIR